MTGRATAAAQELSAVLLAQAENLASDELITVSSAMTAVRAAAREVEASLTARGWGGGVLYGFDESLDDDPDESLGAEDLDDLDDEDLDDGGPWVAPAGVRMTYQARYDYVIVDEDAFLAYVERRAAEAGESMSRDEIVEHTPAYVLGMIERTDQHRCAMAAGGRR
jgi:hypothetical protein